MPFVKLDCGILRSTLWGDRLAREVFLTALLMAEPREIVEPMPQMEVDSADSTGWVVPPGWYGFVEAAGRAISRTADIPYDEGLLALKRLGSPEPDSRSPDFEGRRLVRVDGGYVVLNFIKYREKDASAADRVRRWREREKIKKQRPKRVTNTLLRVTANQAEAEAEVQVQAENVHEKGVRTAGDVPGTKEPPAAAAHNVTASRVTDTPTRVTARSKHPIFKGQRFVVFEWQLSDLMQLLGPHTDAFDLHAWFYELDAKVQADGTVIPQRDGGAWLLSETMNEAKRRGLPVAIVRSGPETFGQRMAALMAGTGDL